MVYVRFGRTLVSSLRLLSRMDPQGLWFGIRSVTGFRRVSATCLRDKWVFERFHRPAGVTLYRFRGNTRAHRCRRFGCWRSRLVGFQFYISRWTRFNRFVRRRNNSLHLSSECLCQYTVRIRLCEWVGIRLLSESVFLVINVLAVVLGDLRIETKKFSKKMNFFEKFGSTSKNPTGILTE